MEALSRPVPIICELSWASVEDLLAIENESNTPPWSRRLFAQEFSSDFSVVFGARLGGELVGFLVSHIIVDEGHIVNFGVRKAYRGEGIGRTLLCHALTEFHARGLLWAYLEVRRSNRIAQNLYNSVGFIEAGVRERYYSDNHEDGITMRLNIRDFIDR